MPEGKIINTLKYRRQIEAAIESLVRARTEEESHPYLRALVNYGAQVLPVLMTYLDTPDPWVVRALGRVFAQLDDRERAGRMLRRAILSPASSDRRRIVAMVLLNQFLERPLDDALFAALGNPTEVAVRALLRDRPIEEQVVRLDYLSIIHAQPIQEIRYAIGQFREHAGPSSIEALRFFALDERESLAVLAIEGLGAIREPASLRALRILEANVPSVRHPQVERMIHKLQLSGVQEPPVLVPPPGTRVLISPIDGAGNRLILVLFPHEENCQVLHLFLDDEQGVRGTYKVVQPAGELPAPSPVGTVLAAPHPWQGIFLLESTFAYARKLLRRALEYNHAQRSPGPLEYRFFCDQIWAWSVQEVKLPVLSPFHGSPSQQVVSTLLGHPYLASWFLESADIYETAQRLMPADLSSPEGQGLLALATVSLIQSEFPAEVCLKYAGRLEDTAEWLLRGGDHGLARVALAAGEELALVQPLRSIFALMLMQKSVLIAVEHLRRGMDLSGRTPTASS